MCVCVLHAHEGDGERERERERESPNLSYVLRFGVGCGVKLVISLFCLVCFPTSLLICGSCLSQGGTNEWPHSSMGMGLTLLVEV